MCTVTYIPLGKNNFILTSNRDENPLRKTITPTTYTEDDVKLIYPKDTLAGGTWIGLSERNRLVCLLNGGFEIHKREVSYKFSRGVIVKQLLKTEDAVGLIEGYDFEGIEPFTIVLVDWQKELKAFELVWTGTEKYFQLLKDEPKIWSSSTLYNNEMKNLRKGWFDDWLNTVNSFTQEKIIDFHKDETKGTPDVSFKMKRDRVETVSITSVLKNEENVAMSYINLIEN